MSQMSQKHSGGQMKRLVECGNDIKGWEKHIHKYKVDQFYERAEGVRVSGYAALNTSSVARS